jgi:hypothetical protein
VAVEEQVSSLARLEKELIFSPEGNREPWKVEAGQVT